MPLEARINAAKKTVYSIATGRVEIGEVIQVIEDLASHGDFKADFSHLVDLTKIIEPPVVHNTGEISEVLQAIKNTLDGRIALVVSDYVAQAVVNLISALAAKDGITLKAFLDIEEATTWIEFKEIIMPQL